MSADGTYKSGEGLNLDLAASDVETALMLASDIVVVTDLDGVVQAAKLNDAARQPGVSVTDWVGCNLSDNLTDESIAKFEQRVLNASAPVIAAIELNHIDKHSADFPVRYACTRAGGKILMLGRDLRAIAEIQQDLTGMHVELERERQSQRQFETKYRLLMQFG